MKSVAGKSEVYHDTLAIEEGIWNLKTYFMERLRHALHLSRVVAPILVESGMGINDDLNGIELPLGFVSSSLEGRRVEVVQSLAKWKRLKLAAAGVRPGRGIVTDMRAIRPNESLSPIHSLAVDQWDWEMSIEPKQRNLEFLKMIVIQIYSAIKDCEQYASVLFPLLQPQLPAAITFIHAEDLQMMYPNLSPKEREYVATKQYGAVFIVGIGGMLADGEPHDSRAPDYDDWSTPTLPGKHGLNGDILVWDSELEMALELSSMGIRVDKESLVRQLKIHGAEHRSEFYFHKQLLADALPQCIGGGVGQSRLCMFLLRKQHIGEVQAGVWPSDVMYHNNFKGVRML